MIAIAAAVLFALPAQEEDKLKEAWPKLVEAWRSVEEHKPSETGTFDDNLIRAMGKLHDAFEAAGMFQEHPSYETAALKHLCKLGAKNLFPGSSNGVLYNMAVAELQFGPRNGQRWVNPMTRGGGMNDLLSSIRRLRELKEKGLDDEDNVAEETTTIRKSLKGLGLIEDETPMWLRRRVTSLAHAMVLGEAYPETARATEEERKQIAGWVEALGSEESEVREKATRELMKCGEKALGELQEALRSQDAEVVARAKKILGVGLEPWTKELYQVDVNNGNVIRLNAARSVLRVHAEAEAVPVVPAPAPVPDEPEDSDKEK